MFGENLTIEGLLEDIVNIGDQFRIGSSVLMVTQPRMPCYKLGIRFGRNDIIKRFLWSCRIGFYLSVLEEGEVSAGDAIELIRQDENNVTVADITRLYVSKKDNLEVLHRAVQVEALPENRRVYFSHKIKKAKPYLVSSCPMS